MKIQVHEPTCPTVLDEDDNEACYCPEEELNS